MRQKVTDKRDTIEIFQQIGQKVTICNLKEKRCLNYLE
jgi:hypothetical protein